jgi:hypothetical protein
VSRDWVDKATAADATDDPADHYQYFWWVDVERPGRFYALGNHGQYLYVAPTPTPSSSASVATGAPATGPGWRASAASPTGWPARAGPAADRRGRAPTAG